SGPPLATNQGLLEAVPVFVLITTGHSKPAARRNNKQEQSCSRRMNINLRKLGTVAVAAALGVSATAAVAQDQIPVGHLAAYTGPTSDVGVVYGQGVEDAVAYINQHGGINGTQINMPTVDYGYEIPRAIATYKKW